MRASKPDRPQTLALVLAALTLACGVSAAGGVGDGKGGTGGGGGDGEGGTGGGTGTVCEFEPGYICVYMCGSDHFTGPECRDGEWTCPEMELAGGTTPTFPSSDCPPETCWGVPLPAEVCRDGQWTCEPADRHFADCPPMICASCAGFPAEGLEREGCRCTCEATGQEVRCVSSSGG